MRKYKKQNPMEQVAKRLLSIVMVIALITLIVWVSVDRNNNYEYHETTTHYVSKGETLWTIAQQYSDNRHDVRKVIYEIEQLSDCTAYIYPGDRLTIPVYEVMKKN